MCDASGNYDDVYIDAITWRGMSGTSVADLLVSLNKLTEGPASVPEKFLLEQNRPNPFNPSTDISFSLPEASHVTLEVFNVVGQKVATLVDNRLEAGEYTYTWDGSDAASGVYLYRITTENIVETRKMILMK
jgi:hypothetical protein